MSEEYSKLPKVIKIVDDYSIVINRGSDSGIDLGARFLIFGGGEELLDPDTGESLGMLELVRGKARVVHLQPKMCTLTSDEYSIIPGKKRIIKRQGGIWTMAGQGGTEEVTEGEERHKAGLEAKVGDYARPV